MRTPFNLSRLHDFNKDTRGTIAIMSAAFIASALAATAIAVDSGSLYTERRTLQGTADLAAMVAAANINRAEAAVASTLKVNNVTAEYTVERGQYTPDLSIPIAQRFVPGQEPFNAVRVELSKPGAVYFARSFTDKVFKIRVKSTSANATLATFSVGSRLLAVRDGIVNKVLGGLTGSNVSLSVMDYEALIKADVQLGGFLNALATRMNITAGTYDDVLKSSAKVGDVLAAATAVTEKSGDTRAASALRMLGSQASALSLGVPLKSMIDLGPLASTKIGDPAPGLDAMFSAMELVSGSAVLANGNRQVQVDLTAEVPGLLSLKLDIGIGEPPQRSAWAAVGQPSSQVRTAQTRLRLVAEVGGTGLLNNITVRLPLYLDLAYGEARLKSVTCSDNGEPTANIAARSGIAEAWIGEVTDYGLTRFTSRPSVAKATLVDAALFRVKALAHLDVGSMNETTLTFDQQDVRDRTIKRTETSSLAESIVTSLLKDVQLEAQVLGLSLTAPTAITGAVTSTLQPFAKPIDNVVFTLLNTLGVHLGEADVKVHGMRCGTAVLAG